jgi:hypothetical protein
VQVATSSSRRAIRRICLAGSILALGACGKADVENSPANAIEEPAANLSMVPRPQPPLDRAALLAAVAQAASASAIGTDDVATQRTLDGRQFELRIRFGCRGPSAKLRETWLGWARDEDGATFRVRAQPTLRAQDELVRRLGGDEFEAVEGFWIPRPWLLEPQCPKRMAAAAAPDETGSEPEDPPSETPVAEPVPTSPRVGIAHFFAESDARTRRRATRAYEAVKSIDPAQPIGTDGFNLVLSGRLQSSPDGRVILCAAASMDSAPECVISADFDHVRIERPDTGELIAEWGGG